MHAKSFLRTAVLITSVLLVTACSNNRGVRGYLFDPDLSNAIQSGVDNRTSVRSTLGSPTIESTFDENTWYYVSTEVRVRPVYWPDAKKHRVMAVSFNDRGVVANVLNYDLEDMREINPVQNETPTLGRNVSFFRQLFTGIGSFSNGPPGGANNDTGRVPNGG